MGGMNTAKHRLVAQKCAELGQLTTPDLRLKWVAYFGGETAPKLKRELLLGALRYQLQVQALGCLKPRVRKQLRDALRTPETTAIRHARSLQVGTRLVRVWQGDTHIVEVSTEGYLWQGQKLSSLSAIAREITGTRWSGPRFFGLHDTDTATCP
jgi:hypothetical protein